MSNTDRFFYLNSTVFLLGYMMIIVPPSETLSRSESGRFGALKSDSTHQDRFITVFTVFRLLTDFVCLYTYEFWTFLFLTTYLYTFSLSENPSFIIFSAETEYISTRSRYRNINFLRDRRRKSVFDIYFTEFVDNCFTCFVQVLLYILL
jgi:hypothetical protein